jgi:hypothetical protein
MENIEKLHSRKQALVRDLHEGLPEHEMKYQLLEHHVRPNRMSTLLGYFYIRFTAEWKRM